MERETLVQNPAITGNPSVRVNREPRLVRIDRNVVCRIRHALAGPVPRLLALCYLLHRLALRNLLEVHINISVVSRSQAPCGLLLYMLQLL